MSSAYERSYRRMLRQRACYWASPTQAGNGSNTFDAPIEITIRWDNVIEAFVDLEGVEQQSSAVILSIDTLELQGYLFLGLLEDLSTAERANPHLLKTARQIRGYEETPTIKADFFVKKSFL